jgi:hypothetical protein
VERLFRDFPKVFKYPLVLLAMGRGLKLPRLPGAEFEPTEIRASYRLLSASRYSRRDAAQSRWLAGSAHFGING